MMHSYSFRFILHKTFIRHNFPLFLFILSLSFLFPDQLRAKNCTVNAGIDQSICTNTATLVGQASGLFPGGSAVVTWSQTSGPSAVITSPHELTTTVTNLMGGNVYKFMLSCPCEDGEIATNEVTITVGVIPVANAGADQGVKCNGTNVLTLAAQPLLTNETGAWTQDPGNPSGVTVNSPTSPTSTVTLTNSGTSGTVILIWTVTNTVSGCITSDNMSFIKAGGSNTITAAATTPTACYNTTTQTSLTGSQAGTGAGGQGGLWTVVSGPNTPTILAPTSRTTTATNLIAGTYTFRWTVTGPCINGSKDVTITVPPPVGATTTATASIQGSPSSPFCDGRSSITLLGNTALVSGETGTWSKTVGGSATFSCTQCPTSTVTGLDGTSSYTFQYLIANGSTGCTSSKTVTFSYSTDPTLTLITASPYVLPCGTSTATIDYSHTGTGTVQYSILSGPVTTQYPAIPTAYATASGPPAVLPGFTVPGTYIIRFRKNEGTGSACATVYQDITVVVSYAASGSNSGSNQTLACNVTQTQLAGNNPTVGTGTWSQVSGPNTANFVNKNLYNTNVNNLISGAYVFRWLISGGPVCTTQQSDVTVTVATATPNQPTAGPDQSHLCFGTPITMQGSTPSLNETGTWSVVPSAGITFSNVHAPNAIVNGLVASTSYTFTWTVTNGCGTASSSCVISTTSTQGPLQSNAGPNQCQPAGTSSITLNGNSPSPVGGTGSWSKYEGGSASIVSPSSPNSLVTGLSNGTYQFIWTLTYGTCAFSYDTVMITISNAASTAVAGIDQTICGNTTTLAATAPTTGTGSWSQVGGPGGASITTPSSNTSAITGLTDGQYTFRWLVSNGACASNYDDVQINVSTTPTTANAGPTINRCGSTTATMAANTPTNGTGFWSIVSGPGSSSPPTITTPTSPTTTITGLSTGDYVFRWTIYSGIYCTPSTSDVIVHVTPNASAGSTQNLCNAETTSLTGNTNTSGTWSYVSGPNTPTITPTSGNAASVTGMIPGTYVFKYTLPAMNGCSSTSANVTVNNSLPPSDAVAGSDQGLCNVTGWTFSATAPATGTGTWVKVAGSDDPLISDPSSPTATVTNATAQTYIFQWKVTNGGCTSEDNVTISISNIAPSAYAGPDQPNLCGTVATMAATPVAGSGWGVGTWSKITGGAATISSLIDPNTTITGLVPNSTYVFRWTISSGSCTPVYSDVTINTHALPTTANAGVNQNLCNATSTTLAGNTLSSGTGLWSQISGPNSATITSPTLSNSTVTNMIPGTYVFQWTATLAPCSSSSQVTITNSQPPSTAVVTTPIDNCLFSPLNLSATVPLVGSGLWSQISGPTTTITDPSSPTTSILGAQPGTYVYRWTVSNGTCTSSTADATVNVTNIPTTAAAGPNVNLTCNTTTYTLAGNEPTVGTGTWSQISGPNSAGITNPNLFNTGLTGIVPGTYVFQWQIVNGTCTSSDQMQLVLNPAQPNLVITKTNGSPSYGAGRINTYTLTVTNTGLNTATNAVVNEAAPAGTSITSWSAVFSGGATGNTSGTGNINQVVTIPVNGTIVYTVEVDVPCNYSGSLTNTATIAASDCDIEQEPLNNSSTVVSQPNLWTGNANNEWSNASNWSLGVVPSCSPAINAIISTGETIVVSTHATAANLTIEAGSKVIVLPGKSLTVCGCTKVEEPEGLVVECDLVDGQGAFIDNGTINYSVDGTIKVELCLSPCDVDTTNQGCWHYFTPSIPVAKGSLFVGDFLREFDEPTGNWSNYLTNTNYDFIGGHGYAISNKSISNVKRLFVGHTNTNSVTTNLTYTATKGNGWNLAGNPFPSPINLNSAAITWQNVEAKVWYYDQINKAYKPYVVGGPQGTNPGSQYAPGMQGFFVHVPSGTNGSITFGNDARTSTKEVNFYKNDESLENILWITAEGQDGLKDEAVVYFRPEATLNYDSPYDCLKLYGSDDALQLYTVTDNSYNVAINALDFTGVNTTIPLHFSIFSDITESVTLLASKLESFRFGTKITLEDTKANKTQDLTSNPEYTFTYSNSDPSDRFLLHFYNPFFGIDDHSETRSFKIYSSGATVYIKELTGHLQRGTINVYALDGRFIAQETMDPQPVNGFQMHVEDGIYIIQLVTDKETIVEKIYLKSR